MYTGFPAFSAAEKLAHCSLSTPLEGERERERERERGERLCVCPNNSLEQLTITFTRGMKCLRVTAIPASKPPPPTGMTTASQLTPSLSIWLTTSSAAVPCPAKDPWVIIAIHVQHVSLFGQFECCFLCLSNVRP